MILDATSTMKRWQHQLDYNLRTAHAQTKFLNLIPPSEPFEWCGFQFHLDHAGLSWRITPSTLDIWNSIAKSNPQPTARSLWRVLGFANFAFTILQLPTRILGPARLHQAHLGLVKENDWDTNRPHLQTPIRYTLDTITSINNTWQRRKMRKMPREEDILRIVFDATPSRWAVVIFKSDGSTEEHSGVLNCNIDVAEATACSKAHKIITQKQPRLTIIAGDNIGVLRAFFKGYSTSDEIQHQILFSACTEYPGVILLVDLPSEENFADIASRPEEIYELEDVEKRKKSTQNRFDRALSNWYHTGATYTSRFPEQSPTNTPVNSPDTSDEDEQH
jgi:hypothetical protein